MSEQVLKKANNFNTLDTIAYSAGYFPYIQSWLESRGLPLWSEFCVPSVGFVAIYDSIPVAIGFLRLIEGGLGMVDGLITDPSAPSEVRHSANDSITSNIISKAKSMGLSGLISFTTDPHTITRSEKHGFKIQSQVVIVLNLEEV